MKNSASKKIIKAYNSNQDDSFSLERLIREYELLGPATGKPFSKEEKSEISADEAETEYWKLATKGQKDLLTQDEKDKMKEFGKIAKENGKEL